MTTAIALVAASGLSVIKVHRDALTMWLPAGSAAQVNEARYALLTGRPRPRSLVLLVEMDGASTAQAPPSLSSAAQLAPTPLKRALAYAMDIHHAVRSCGLHNVSAGSGLSGSDGVFSPLQLWDYSHDVLELDTDPLGTIQAALFGGGGGDGGGTGDDGDGIDGGVTVGVLRSMLRLLPPTVAAKGSANELSALLLVYNLDGTLDAKSSVVEFERRVRETLSAEESVWRPALARSVSANASDDAHAYHIPTARVHVFSESALSDDLYAAVGDDTLMIGASITMMCVYVTAFLSRHRDLLRLRSIPSSAAVLSVLLATLSAFGTAAALGIEYNYNVNLAIFVILGVGIDDAFVIVRALDNLPPIAIEPLGKGRGASPSTHEQVAQRVGAALGACGSAILLSSTTNAIAFALGARSPLPALQGFCAYAALGMVFDFGFQITFFVAVVALDEQRQSAGRAVVPCFRVGAATLSSAPTADHWRDEHTSRPSRLNHRRFARLAQTLALCTYAVTLCMSIYASYSLRVGFQPEELVSGTSRVAKYAPILAPPLHSGRHQLQILPAVRTETSSLRRAGTLMHRRVSSPPRRISSKWSCCTTRRTLS
jgi:hypothetical protein